MTPLIEGYRLPAEWEPHAATWLAWPHQRADWPGKFEVVAWVFCEMVLRLQEVERVSLIVASEAMLAEARQALEKTGVPLERVEFFLAPTDRSWTRDFLPTFVVRPRSPASAPVPSSTLGASSGAASAAQAALGAVKWRFNGWARYPNHELDDAAGQRVAVARAGKVWQPNASNVHDAPRAVLEGGAIDADGEGTLLTTEACLLGAAHARNPSIDRRGNERLLRDYLGIERVLWLPGGIAGDDTSGHVDDVARFVAPGRIVLAEESNPSDPNYTFLNAAREYLEAERDARGRRLEVIGLPMPAPRYFAGDRLPMTYANFYIANERVLVPTFNDPADQDALGLLSELFPERQVIGIHCLDLVLGLGALHCSTHEEPLV